MRDILKDGNNNIIQCAQLSKCKDYEVGVIPDLFTGYIRVKNIGDGSARIRYEGEDSTGMYLSSGETEYISVDSSKKLEVVEGTVNIMF